MTTTLAETNNLTMQRNTFRNLQYAIRNLFCVLLFFLSACGSIATPTPFIAPRSPKITPTARLFSTPTFQVTLPPAANYPESLPGTLSGVADIATTATDSVLLQILVTPELPNTLEPTLEPTIPEPTAELSSPTPKACSDSLRYLEDINYPDDSIVSSGQAIEKQWRVENNGSCDWDGRYQLKLLDGYPALGAPVEMVLFPARAGTQAVLSVYFIAPAEAGSYHTAWQAFNPEGLAFGEVVYMVIIVN
jgi:hypothetical protein